MLRHRPIFTCSSLLLASALSSSLAAQEFVAHRLFVISSADNRLYGYGGNEAILDQNAEAHTTGAFAVDAGLDFTLGSGSNAAGEMAFAPDGTLFITSLPDRRVFALDPEGNLVREFGAGVSDFLPISVALGPDGETYVGSSVGNDPIHVFDAQGQHVRAFGPAGGVSITGLAFDFGTHLFASCLLVDVVKELDPSGKLVRNIGVGVLVDPRGLAFGPDGMLYVASSGTDEVVVFGKQGEVVKKLGAGILDKPVGVAFGPDGRLYVTCQDSNSVVVFDGLEETSPTTSFGDSELRGPLGLAFVPTRIKATLRGLLGDTGAAVANAREAAVLSIPACAPRLMIAFDDPSGKITEHFGSPWAVFQGFLSFEQDDDSLRMLYGVQVAPEPNVDGTASMAAALRGHLRGDGVWEPKRAIGTLHLATPTVIWNARFTSGHVLND